MNDLSLGKTMLGICQGFNASTGKRKKVEHQPGVGVSAIPCSYSLFPLVYPPFAILCPCSMVWKNVAAPLSNDRHMSRDFGFVVRIAKSLMCLVQSISVELGRNWTNHNCLRSRCKLLRNHAVITNLLWMLSRSSPSLVSCVLLQRRINCSTN